MFLILRILFINQEKKCVLLLFLCTYYLVILCIILCNHKYIWAFDGDDSFPFMKTYPAVRLRKYKEESIRNILGF
jgi:hypothetical protein